VRNDKAQNARTNPSFTLDVASSEVFELNTMGGNDTLKVDFDVTDRRRRNGRRQGLE